MAAARTVRSLRVRAGDEALARRGGVLLEDALRTASLPGDDARLLLIRRLRLPAFRAGASAQSVALGLEAGCGAVRPLVVEAGTLPEEAALEASPAVSFRDALAAHVALARALLAGRTPRAWCWRLLVPEAARAPDPASALAAVALSAARLSPAPAALALWLDDVLLLGGGPLLAASLAARPLPALPSFAVPAGHASAARRRAVLPWRELLASPAVAAGDARLHAWLQTLAPSLALAPSLPAVTRADDPTAGVPAARPGDGTGSSSAPTPGQESPLATGGPAVAPAPGVPALPAAARRPATSVTTAAGAAGGASPLPREAMTPHAPAGGGAGPAGTTVTPGASADAAASAAGTAPLPTAAGGLLFLVPVLARCGLATWLDENPAWLEADLPARILGRLMARLPLPPDDALRALVADLPPASAAPLAARLPADWPVRFGRGRPRRVGDGDRRALFAGDGRLLLATWRGRAPAGWRLPRAPLERRSLPAPALLVADAWLGACRRLLRRELRLGIASLVLRRARVAVTPLWVDVWLPPESVSLPVRRHGLDLDPGWVPWLGRVVHFHYAEAPR